MKRKRGCQKADMWTEATQGCSVHGNYALWEQAARRYIRCDYFIVTHCIIDYDVVWWLFTLKNGCNHCLKTTRDSGTHYSIHGCAPQCSVIVLAGRNGEKEGREGAKWHTSSSLKYKKRLLTVWLNKRRVEKNPTPYWTFSDVSRTHEQHIYL